jgi:ankyrin repeat protein
VAQARDRDGQTPLHWAVQYNQLPLTTFWLQAGASPAATNFAGQTASHIAAAKDLAEHLKLLLAAHAPTDARDTNGWTPLDAAIHAQQPETIRVLLSDKNVPPRSDRAIALPIHQAAASGNLDALVSLAEATNNLEDRDELGMTPLQVAVQHGHLAAAALLVDSGANVNARDPDGNTLLHWIILHNYPGNIYDGPPSNWLARMGQDPRKQAYLKFFTNGQTQFAGGETLLYAGFLLGCGIDASATNRAGQTAMQLALDGNTTPLYGRIPLLKMLAGAGGEINKRNASGNTAFHFSGQTTNADGAGLGDGQLLPRVDPKTGQLVCTDQWGDTPIRDLNPNSRFNVLGTTLALGPGGSNLELHLLTAIIDDGTNDFPDDAGLNFSVQVRSSPDESGPENILGQIHSDVAFDPGLPEFAFVSTTRHGREKLDESHRLFLYEIAFQIPLREKLSMLPEYISLIYSEVNELVFLKYHRQIRSGEAADESSPPNADNAKNQSTTNSQVSKEKPQERPAITNAASAGGSTSWPKVVLSLQREPGYLLIACSPKTEGNKLEGADLKVSPLQWRPVLTGTNDFSNGCYVPPDDGARAFRVKLNPSTPGNP